MTGGPHRLGALLAAQCAADWSTRFDAPAQDALRAIVRTAFIDTIACMFAGGGEPVTSRVAQWAGYRFGDGAMPLPARAGRGALAPPMAALINATAGHALDFDDVGLAGHPSVVLVPALLAVHEADGVRGLALVQAYAKGYAVWAELQTRMTVHLHGRGWHPTAVFGTVAAAAAVASARQMPPVQLAHAIGIAASSASGLIANFGSMTKPLQVGRAARAGIEAAELAACGIESSPDALDGATGLLAALGGPGNARLEPALSEGLEASLLRLRPGIKKYPVCYAAHRVADGVLDLVAAHGVRPAEVTSVDATISATTAAVLRHHAPATLAEARFSLEYVVATALVRGALGLRDVSDDSLADPAVRALMQRVRTHTIDTRCPLEPSFALEDRVTITTETGDVLDSGPIRFARGHAQLPLDESQLRAKLFGCLNAEDEGAGIELLARIDAALKD
jgi:2-methylcitrate dehydratase PrpD